MEEIYMVELNNEKNRVKEVAYKPIVPASKIDESFMVFTMESDRVDLTKEQLKTLRAASPRIVKAIADMRDHHVYIIGDPELTTYEASDYLDILVDMFNLDWDRVTITVNGRV